MTKQELKTFLIKHYKDIVEICYGFETDLHENNNTFEQYLDTLRWENNNGDMHLKRVLMDYEPLIHDIWNSYANDISMEIGSVDFVAQEWAFYVDMEVEKFFEHGVNDFDLRR